VKSKSHLTILFFILKVVGQFDFAARQIINLRLRTISARRACSATTAENEVRNVIELSQVRYLLFVE
jgi:hypothetical protein